MILNRLQFTDFGLYAGRIEFDLAPRRHRGVAAPIILVGGRNGAGKTTLLEGVRLALYGRRALGPRVSRQEYHAYLAGRVHRGAGVAGASVEIAFDYAEAGVVHTYRVLRAWTVAGQTVNEILELEKDGAPVHAVPREEWHQFLQELIPPGVSQLFFFDGEKIGEIADDDAGDGQLAAAIKALLGLDLIGRLQLDLGVFLARQKDREGDALVARLEGLTAEIEAETARALDLSDALAEVVSARHAQAQKADRVRNAFVAEGGEAALQRSRIEGELVELGRQRLAAEHELRDMANRLLPFAMAPKVVGSFLTAFRHAAGTANDAGTVSRLLGDLRAWREAPADGRAADWSDDHWSDLLAFVSREASVGAATSPAFREVGDGASALARLDEVDRAARPRAMALREQLDGLVETIQAHEASLVRANGAASGVLLDDLRATEQTLGALTATVKLRQDALATVRGRLFTLERERRTLIDVQAQSVQSDERQALAARVGLALAEYETRLLDRKLKDLRSEFVECFRLLARKADFVSDVLIDRDTFAMTLLDGSGQVLPRSALSAGEKQIYAIALLWALARTSGRPLPMIIDTPLARLDTEHRARLAERYFPAASHQVILLSTDTEIDGELADGLRPHISHVYRLDYDAERCTTSAQPGYFRGRPTSTRLIDALQQA
ncbi:DNA sulfur modification protein DndD [Brevundimonas goettingensis]|nr:DNA sulfur modification protein DndD [Brevundimonas goettingensis]